MATAANPLSIATEVPSASIERRAEAVFGRAGVHLAVGVGPFGDVDPEPRLHVGNLGVEHPAQPVDRVRTPRPDPAPAELTVEEPTPRAQWHPGTRREARELHVLDVSELARRDHVAQDAARRRVAELEVAQRHDSRGAGLGLEVGGLVGVERERLVAENGLARGERAPHVGRVQIRR